MVKNFRLSFFLMTPRTELTLTGKRQVWLSGFYSPRIYKSALRTAISLMLITIWNSEDAYCTDVNHQYVSAISHRITFKCFNILHETLFRYSVAGFVAQFCFRIWFDLGLSFANVMFWNSHTEHCRRTSSHMANVGEKTHVYIIMCVAVYILSHVYALQNCDWLIPMCTQ